MIFNVNLTFSSSKYTHVAALASPFLRMLHAYKHLLVIDCPLFLHRTHGVSYYVLNRVFWVGSNCIYGFIGITPYIVNICVCQRLSGSVRTLWTVLPWRRHRNECCIFNMTFFYRNAPWTRFSSRQAKHNIAELQVSVSACSTTNRHMLVPLSIV